MIFQWRAVLDDWKAEHNTETKIMMTEAYANISFTMKYYESEDGQRKGSHMPFNFLLITDLNENSTAPDYVTAINKWMSNMPSGKTANWVLGNHDNPRVGSRYGVDRIDAMTFLLMTLPGAAVTYNGDEIGMLDYRDISWEDTVDPAACNTNPDVYKKFSRDPERTPFQWSAQKNSGFSKADKTWLPVNPNYETLNLEAEQPRVFSHYSIYKRLAELRKEPSFVQGSFHVQALNQNVLAFVRQLIGHEIYVIIINVGNQEEVVDLSVFSELPDKLTVVEVSSKSVYKKE
jgi:alpha-glucosidase